MRGYVKAVIFLILTWCTIMGQGEEAHASRLALAAPLTSELNLILRASEALHRSLIGQNDEQIEVGLRDILWQIDRTRGALYLAKPHERGHLLKILDAAREQFELTQTSFGEERRERLTDAYNHISNLVRIYRLDRDYLIFFCPKDRTTWVQRGARPQNPFRADLRREQCGIRVSK
jgi:hypothetical protein